MGRPNKIVVEAVVPASVEEVWERTQNPAKHVAWDIRFTHIQYLEETDERGFALMDYRTDVALGVEVKGIGRYLHSQKLVNSTFEFDSDDWKSIIKDGRGIWLYEERGDSTYFKTVYDYKHRHGSIGLLLDKLLFRRLLQLATEWGFETLRLWCAGDKDAPRRRRARWRFMAFFVRRFFVGPAKQAARSWLGSGKESQLLELAASSAEA